MIEKFVQLRFQETTDLGVYRSSIILSEADFNAATPEELNAMIDANTRAYLANVRNTTPEPNYTEPQLQEIRLSLEQEAVRVADEIVRVDELIAQAPIIAADTTPPTRPNNLKIIKNTRDIISLSWDASTDNVAMSHYRVYRNAVRHREVRDPYFNDSEFRLGSEYAYQVSAVDKAGNESARSNTVRYPQNAPDPTSIGTGR